MCTHDLNKGTVHCRQLKHVRYVPSSYLFIQKPNFQQFLHSFYVCEDDFQPVKGKGEEKKALFSSTFSCGTGWSLYKGGIKGLCFVMHVVGH